VWRSARHYGRSGLLCFDRVRFPPGGHLLLQPHDEMCAVANTSLCRSHRPHTFRRPHATSRLSRPEPPGNGVGCRRDRNHRVGQDARLGLDLYQSCFIAGGFIGCVRRSVVRASTMLRRTPSTHHARRSRCPPDPQHALAESRSGVHHPTSLERYPKLGSNLCAKQHALDLRKIRRHGPGHNVEAKDCATA
jgi:hypothetical protein